MAFGSIHLVSLKRHMRAAGRALNRASASLFPRGGFDFARQFLILSVCYVVYRIVRSLACGREVTAFANARHIMNAEKALHIYIEPWLQAKLSHTEALLRFFDFVYMFPHVPVTIGCLIWIYARRREVFAFFRNWFLAMNGLAVICFALLPTAPPRSLPTSGMVDTLYLFSSANFQSGVAGWFTNPFAAMPSLHIGYALFVTMAILALARGRLMRVLAVIYPCVVLLGIVVTGNHFLFDALAGGLVVYAAYLVAVSVSAVGAGEPLPVTWRDAQSQ
jgi:hypothetical protein